MQQNAQYRAALSYVTGAHSFKVGYQGAYMIAKTPSFLGQQISYRFNNGVPEPVDAAPRSDADQQSHGARRVLRPGSVDAVRLTLQGGLRYEHVRSFFPEGENGVVEAHRFGPAFTFPRTRACAATTTSRRAWARRTTSSATARRR